MLLIEIWILVYVGFNVMFIMGGGHLLWYEWNRYINNQSGPTEDETVQLTLDMETLNTDKSNSVKCIQQVWNKI